MNIELEALENKVKELREERTEIDNLIQITQSELNNVINSNPQVIELRTKVNQLVADRNVKTGTLNAFEELVKMTKGDLDLPEDPTKKTKSKKKK